MTTSELAEKIRAKFPGKYDQVDDRTLVDKWLVKYPAYRSQIEDTPIMDAVAGDAARAAVVPLTAPATLLAGQDPAQMPNAETVNAVSDEAKKVWETAGIPEQGLKGISSIGSDVVGAIRQGGMPPGEDWKTVIQRAADVTEGRQEPPKVAGFLAGMMDPRGIALGEALNPMVKWGATQAAEAVAPAATWLAKRVLHFSKRMVGNQYARGMADAAAEYATKPHPEIQQAIMDLTERGAPKAADVAEDVAAGGGETTVRPPGGILPAAKGLPVMTGTTTGEPYALFDYNDFSGSSYKIYGDPKLTGIETTGNQGIDYLRAKGIKVIGKTEKAAKLGHEPLDDLGGMGPPPAEPVIKGGDAEEGGALLKGDVKTGPKGAEFDANLPVGEESAPAGIEALGRPIIHMTADTGDMYNHVGTQLKVTGEAIESALKSLDSSGQKWEPGPALKQLESMYQRNASGDIIDLYHQGISPQADYNQAVSKVMEAIKAKATETPSSANNFNPPIRAISWEDANQLKGMIQQLANYAKPKFDPENMVYSHAGATIRDSIDRQGAKIMASQGQDIQAFEAVRGAYSKLKVVEESLNNKFASEESMKNVLPVLRTTGVVAALGTGHPKTAMAILADYLIREYGPQTGAQMLRAISENPAALGAGAGNVARKLSPAASAIGQAFNGENR